MLKEHKHLKYYIILIIASSLVTHFLFFGQPRETVFDEVHFGKFISGYFTHEYFFDIHPPLGKLMLSGMGYITGFKPGFSFAEIGQKFPDQHYLWLRLLPTVAGAILPIVIFYLVLELGLSSLAAFGAGVLIVFENATLVQSRLILLDAFLLLFGFSALLFYFRYRNSSHDQGARKWTYLVLSGLSGALAVSVKWTGGTFLAIIAAMYLIDVLKDTGRIKKLFIGTAALAVLPFIIYFSIFLLHFSLLSKSGPGDAFMTQSFRKTLAGSTDSANPDIKPLNLIQKFTELNIQMYKSNATLTAGHPYSSKWYTWPFMIRPVYYWYEAPQNGTQAASRIYFLGNPVIWWVSTAAIIFLILNTLNLAYRGLRPGAGVILLTGAYFFNMLPFIGIKRAMFLYHYMSGLIFSIIALVYLIDRLSPPQKKKALAALLAASVVAFIFFAPLSYGLPLTEKAYNLRNWLGTWI